MTILTKKSFKEACEATGGTKTQIADYLLISFVAVYNYCKKHPEYTSNLMDIQKRKNNSKCKENIIQIANMDVTGENGEVVPALVGQKLKANESWLKTQAKDEGWADEKNINIKAEVTTLTKEERQAEIKRLLEL